MRRAPPCTSCNAGHFRQTPFFRVLQCDNCRTGTADLDGPGRIGCLVPFCRATRGDHKGDRPLTDGCEWICERHYRMIPRALKRRRAALRRLAGRADEARRARINRLDHILWQRAKRIATEAAGGIC